MATPSFASQDLLAHLQEAGAVGDVDRIREILHAALQHLIDLEAAISIGADRYERTPERSNHRNGNRPRTLDTAAGRLELAIPKFRHGSFLPCLLEPRRRIDRGCAPIL